MMVSRRKDYASAKQYIIDLTNTYSCKIVPDGVEMRTFIRNVTEKECGGCGHSVIAYAAGNKDWTKTAIFYDSKIIKNNMYNMKSKFFDALIVHELCHIKHGFEEPGASPRVYHSRPIYLDCMEKFFGREMATARTHPDRYSFRAYLGSEHKIVPSSINNIIYYVCKDCRSSALWNLYYIGHHPYHCESCHSKNIAWTILNPFDVYRIATINEIDNFERTIPAVYN